MVPFICTLHRCVFALPANIAVQTAVPASRGWVSVRSAVWSGILPRPVLCCWIFPCLFTACTLLFENFCFVFRCAVPINRLVCSRVAFVLFFSNPFFLCVCVHVQYLINLLFVVFLLKFKGIFWVIFIPLTPAALPSEQCTSKLLGAFQSLQYFLKIIPLFFLILKNAFLKKEQNLFFNEEIIQNAVHVYTKTFNF